VRLARSGSEALAVVESFASDVAILDIGLRDIDRFELARRLVTGVRGAQASGRARIAHPVESRRGSPAFPPGTANQVLHRGH
jgi:CheY-like chemotaxis protein